MIGPTRRSLLPALRGLAVLLLVSTAASAIAQEPAKVNPFGAAHEERNDAVVGYLELSDGTAFAGKLYLTRDKRLKLYDDQVRRQREVPLRAIREIECTVKKEWMEQEWRFKEGASNEKVFTGRSYPAREYLHTVTLQDGRKLTGPLSEIVYVEPAADSPGATEGQQAEPKRFLLHKRDKGSVGDELKSLLYVRQIKLGEEALEEGKRRAGQQPSRSESKVTPSR